MQEELKQARKAFEVDEEKLASFEWYVRDFNFLEE